MNAYYNEIDPYAAAWLRNLIAAGHIAGGFVDERSIEDVHPSAHTVVGFFSPRPSAWQLDMAHPPDFARAIANPRLREATPAVSELTPEMLAQLWARMPRGSLPREQIFAGAVALAVEAAAAARETT